MSQPEENKVIIDGQTYYGGLNQPNLKFVKVNVDCWERVFDFLSLRDILAMSQTCQRMRQIGGHYFRENFHGTTCYLHESSSDLRISIKDNHIKRHDFLRFIDTIQIGHELEHLHTVANMNLLSSLTTLRMWRINLTECKLHGLENIRTNIEAIELTKCSIDENSVGEFLASYPKLKCLRLNGVDFTSLEAKTSLFQRTYPQLEYFEFTNPKGTAQMIPFLERNPKIKSLRIADEDLQAIELDTSTVQVDYLNIDICRATNANQVLNQLKTLHVNGFFKKLRLSIVYPPDDFDSEMFIREMISFNALEVLEIFNFFTNNMSHLSQLKELHLILLNDDTNLETMATNLVNLEQLRIDGTVDQLSSFLRHSRKLKFIIFDNYTGDYGALNLFNLNCVRKMGGMQQKVRIGIHNECQYLATKWKENNTNYDLVEIAREESIRKHFYYCS